MKRKYIFKSKRIGFSLWKESDFDLAYGLWSDRLVTSLIGGPFSKEQIKHRISDEIKNYAKYKVQYFPIFSLDNEEFLGCAGLRPITEQEKLIFECGIHLQTHAQGNGFGCEALDRAIDYGFTLDIDEIYAGHSPLNMPSKGLLKKIGFIYLKDSYYEPTGLMHPWYMISRK